MIADVENIFEAGRRGYSELSERSNDDIADYFSCIAPEQAQVHISNIKGILFEQTYVDQLES